MQTGPGTPFRQPQIPDVISHVGVVLSFGAGNATPRFHQATVGAVIARLFAARSQQRDMPVIGFLVSASEQGYAWIVGPVREGLKQAGFVEGENLAIEYRWADYHYDRLPKLAAELVQRQVSVIFTTGSIVSALAAKSATSSIPIVFANGSDPVRYGLVASLNHPGGNPG